MSAGSGSWNYPMNQATKASKLGSINHSSEPLANISKQKKKKIRADRETKERRLKTPGLKANNKLVALVALVTNQLDVKIREKREKKMNQQ